MDCFDNGEVELELLGAVYSTKAEDDCSFNCCNCSA